MPELIPAAPGSPDWLAARRQGVTATDIVTILGLSSWSSPYSLFWQKMGQVPETPDNDRFRLGRTLQPYVADRWCEQNEPGLIREGALYRHSGRAWQMATPDGLTYTTDEYLWANGVLEVKTWADADKPAWQDGPPPAVRAQVLWQMDVMDVGAGHVAVVFLPSGEFRSYVIDHADCDHVPGQNPAEVCSICWDLCLMREAGEEFMARLRLELPAPDPDASAATLAAVKARFARQPDKQAEIDRDAWDNWLFFKEGIDTATRAAREWESKLREQAGEASVLTVDGQPVARRIVGDSPVKAHTRHSDYLRRIAPKEADSE